MKDLTLSILFFFVSLLFGFSLLYWSYSLLRNWLYKNAGIEHNSGLTGIMGAGLSVSLALICSRAAEAVIAMLQVFAESGEENWRIKAMGFLLLFYLCLSAITLLILFGGLYYFGKLSREVNELEELKNGNTGMAWLLAGILISLGLILRDPVVAMLQNIIPFPEFPVE